MIRRPTMLASATVLGAHWATALATIAVLAIVAMAAAARAFLIIVGTPRWGTPRSAAPV